MALLEQIIRRDDGTEVRLLAQAYFGLGLHCSIGVDVFRRDKPDEPWKLTSDKPHPDWRSMSRSDYEKFGRSEKLRTASTGEILKISNMLRESLAL